MRLKVHREADPCKSHLFYPPSYCQGNKQHWAPGLKDTTSTAPTDPRQHRTGCYSYTAGTGSAGVFVFMWACHQEAGLEARREDGASSCLQAFCPFSEEERAHISCSHNPSASSTVPARHMVVTHEFLRTRRNGWIDGGWLIHCCVPRAQGTRDGCG